jgi:murein DD-endopeptidase MepM/ murein hydrolase activator NlpD
VTDPQPTAAPTSGATTPARRATDRDPSLQSDRRGLRRARAATYVGVAVAAALAVYYTPQAPATRPVSDLVAEAELPATAPVPAPVPEWQHRVDTLGRGESLASVLERAGLTRAQAEAAARAAAEKRGLRAGLAVTTVARTGDSLPAEIRFKPAVDRVVHLRYLAGEWQKMEEQLAWHTDTVAARGAIQSSLHEALHRALGDRLPSSQRSQLVWKLADIFEYRVDMSRDLQPGDSVRLLVERRVDPEGTPREAQILAATLSVDGKPVEAIRYEPRRGSPRFFDGSGKSLRAAFLRAPLEFRRISSVFGRRNHPVLGVWRMHKGTDYAAASGTPVRAIGEGTVIFAGWKSGFGNVLEVRHANGYVSRYGHLRGFAKGVRRGTTVAIGRTIGYVGMTGLASGPHLHFEMLVGGVQRDPRKALRDKVAEPIPAREKSQFAALRSRLLAALDVSPAPATPTRVSSAN